MKRVARFVSLCLLIVFATDTFAKGVDPIRHASGSAEARLVLESFQNRVLEKFSTSSVSRQESILFGMYRMGVKAQNKLEAMDLEKIAARINKRAARAESAAQLSGDEQSASEFISEVTPAEATAPVTVTASHVDEILTSSREAIADLGTPVDAKGKFEALNRTQFLEAIHQQFSGDGDVATGLAEALRTLFFVILGILAIAAIAIVGLSGAAFGVVGAVIAAGLIGVAVLIVLQL